jgi:hypothetical protein
MEPPAMKSKGTKNAVPFPIAPEDVVAQLHRLTESKLTAMTYSFATNGKAFHGERTKPGAGIRSCHAELTDQGVISLQLELLAVPAGTRMPVAALAPLEEITKERRVLFTRNNQRADEFSIWLELPVEAQPLTITREAVFLDELTRADEAAKKFQAELPLTYDERDLDALYEGVSSFVAPVRGWGPDCAAAGLDWARETFDFLRAHCSVAVVAPYPILSDYCISALAAAAQECGTTLGQIVLPSVNAKTLVGLAREAPGTVVVPAERMSLGSSQYEIGNEIPALLSALTESATPLVFVGNRGQLQAVFHGGQGGANDPTKPIVRAAPNAVPLQDLARFAVRTAGRQVGGLSPKSEDRLTTHTLRAIEGRPSADQLRTLRAVASHVVNGHDKGKQQTRDRSAAFATRLLHLEETLSGLPTKPRAARAAHVQERFRDVLTGSTLLRTLRESLIGQDAPLADLVDRLSAEILTRPLHQPLRYCAQGTPGTGKSESAVLLAAALRVPYINIDAPSMPDYYTAAAQLLGGGRGLVGSHQAGRLEQAAKHHAGAVVEVSDLDHALPTVRHALADLFLQVLETGEAQSGAGALFACSNIIFAFTMNLPQGQDEAVRIKMGFHDSISPSELRGRVTDAIKQCLSGAFLSRVGSPILFAPLSPAALATIAARAIDAAVRAAAERRGFALRDVILDDPVGATVVATMESDIISYGARVLFEHCRSMAARAVLEIPTGNAKGDLIVRVRACPDGTLGITRIQPTEDRS